MRRAAGLFLRLSQIVCLLWYLRWVCGVDSCCRMFLVPWASRYLFLCLLCVVTTAVGGSWCGGMWWNLCVESCFVVAGVYQVMVPKTCALRRQEHTSTQHTRLPQSQPTSTHRGNNPRQHSQKRRSSRRSTNHHVQSLISQTNGAGQYSRFNLPTPHGTALDPCSW